MPTVQIASPTDGQEFAPTDEFIITISVADDGAVQSVALYLDGALASEDATAPFEGWAPKSAHVE